MIFLLVTALFLHTGVIHLIINLCVQTRFGLFLERRWRWPKLVTIYFTSGLGGTLASCVFHPNLISAGASGSVMGLMGAYLSEIVLTWQRTESSSRRSSLIFCLAVIAGGILLGFVGKIGWACHLAALVIGIFLGLYSFVEETDYLFVKRILPMTTISIVIMVYFVLSVLLFLIGPLKRQWPCETLNG